MKLDLIELARVKPIDVKSSNMDSARFYVSVVPSIIDEKLAVDYIEIVRHLEKLAPKRQPAWLTLITNVISSEPTLAVLLQH